LERNGNIVVIVVVAVVGAESVEDTRKAAGGSSRTAPMFLGENIAGDESERIGGGMEIDEEDEIGGGSDVGSSNRSCGAGVRLVAARIPPYSKEEHATPPPARQPRVSLNRLTSCL